MKCCGANKVGLRCLPVLIWAGRSLLLVRLHAGLKREFDQELSLVELFQRTTVAAQADQL